LTSAFQIILFVLPGFAAWRFYAVLVPTRRNAGDTEVVIGSIAGSAAIWIAASLVLAGVSSVINWVTSWRGDTCGKHGHSACSWNVDLFTSWLAPSLTAHDFGFHSIGPGVILSAIAIIGGIAAGIFMRKDGRLRVFEVGPLNLGPIHFGRLRYDPSPRVWSAFIATEKGAVFRVRLKSGKFIVGQIEEYSTDPNDDVLEIVMSEYSIAKSENEQLVRSTDTSGLLILRADIELIERLTGKLVEETPSK
jgi:uncharacterized protein DUF6338